MEGNADIDSHPEHSGVWRAPHNASRDRCYPSMEMTFTELCLTIFCLDSISYRWDRCRPVAWHTTVPLEKILALPGEGTRNPTQETAGSTCLLTRGAVVVDKMESQQAKKDEDTVRQQLREG